VGFGSGKKDIIGVIKRPILRGGPFLLEKAMPNGTMISGLALMLWAPLVLILIQVFA
jgi:hypothetical protein